MGPAPAGHATSPASARAGIKRDRRRTHAALPPARHRRVSRHRQRRFAALRLSADSPSPEIWFHHFKKEPAAVRLDIDYCGYLDALTVTKGVSGWQYLFADVDLSSPGVRPCPAQHGAHARRPPGSVPRARLRSLSNPPERTPLTVTRPSSAPPSSTPARPAPRTHKRPRSRI
jgi:hypothetical protein